jgi:hypothetical protein
METPFLVVIQNSAKYIKLMATTTPDGKKSEIGKLVFTRYGNQYFLREILSSSTQNSVELTTSKIEKRARMQQATRQSDQQTVVAQR